MAIPTSTVKRLGIIRTTVPKNRAKIGDIFPSPPKTIPRTSTGRDKITGNRIIPKPFKKVRPDFYLKASTRRSQPQSKMATTRKVLKALL